MSIRRHLRARKWRSRGWHPILGRRAAGCLCAAKMAGLGFALLAAVPFRAGAAEAFFDGLEEALTASVFEDRVRTRLSGTLDLEGYRFSGAAPALIESSERRLFNPRLSVFLDGQIGPQAYVFLQSRLDRGFDPSRRSADVRLDEYALRLQSRGPGSLHVQAGKFATVVGNWTVRHGSWSNPFVTAPLVYESPTGIWDVEALKSAETLLRWSHVRPGLAPHLARIEKSLRLPVVWGPSYATGMAVSGEAWKFRYALEVKNAPLSSRPAVWGRFSGQWEHPTLSGRVGYRPNPMWNLGLSASGGSYLVPAAELTVAPGKNRGDYRQLVLAHDASFAWRHFQLWGEIYATRFEIPNLGDAETVAYYLEVKYKLTPQLFGALRWNQQFFGSVPEGPRRVQWGRDAWRIDLGGGYRFSTHTQLKLQYNVQRGDVDGRRYGHLLAAQFTTRF